jgi:ribosomal protein S11
VKKADNLKGKFYFGFNMLKRRAFIKMKRTHSNFFMTLTDRKSKVIVCKTAAMVIGKLERRRRRKAQQTLDYMVASLDKYFELFKIQGIYLFLKMRPGQYVANLIRSLSARKIMLVKVFCRRKLPFSTTRGRRKKF